MRALPPRKFSNLIEMLAHRATDSPDRVAYTFSREPHTYGEMWAAINRFANDLRRRGLGAGDRLIIGIPNSPEFFVAFYGMQRLGGIAVPIFPGSGIERVLSLARMSGSAAIVVPTETPEKLRRVVAERSGLPVLTVDDSADEATDGDFPAIDPEQVAFFQYTSGSTGDPKGVQLSHANLMTNIEQLIAGMEITEDEVFVSWLPVYHDMGLILKTMVPFYLPATLHLLPASLTNVERWLEAITHHRATFTAAPDFAYRLCLRHVKDPDRFDLSSLRVALNAAEPVRAQTIAEFEKTFGLGDVMTAGYGLAEATVGVAMSTPGTPIKIDDQGFVSVGPSFPEVELAILGDEGLVGTGETGEILVRSSANSRGYYENPEANAGLVWQDGYLRTGDIGYLDDDGHLFIVDRKKNLIIHAGRNLAPREVEEIVDELPFVRFSAAAGIDRGRAEGEQAYVFAEIRDAELPEEELHALTTEVVSAIHGHLGLRPGRVYLVKPRTIPLTHNGKKRYGALKESFLDGSLRTAGMLIYPDY